MLELMVREVDSQESHVPDNKLFECMAKFRHAKRLRWKAKTRKTYNGVLRLFGQYAEEEPWPPSVDLIIDWLEAISRTASPSTVHSYWAHLRAFLNFCERTGEIPPNENPARKLADLEIAPQAPELSPVSYTDNELERLLRNLADIAAGPHKIDKRAIRDYAIILFAYVTGARAGEIVGLCKSDIDFEGKVVLIRRHTSKSSRDHYVALDDVVTNALLSYWKIRPAQAAAIPEFFVSYGGRVGLGRPLKRDALNQMLKRRCIEAGITPRKFHALRHSSALAALDAGLPIHYVRDQLGHRSLESTQIYTRARNVDQINAYRRAALGSRVSRENDRLD